jgi:hypothetical protein
LRNFGNDHNCPDFLTGRQLVQRYPDNPYPPIQLSIWSGDWVQRYPDNPFRPVDFKKPQSHEHPGANQHTAGDMP